MATQQFQLLIKYGSSSLRRNQLVSDYYTGSPKRLDRKKRTESLDQAYERLSAHGRSQRFTGYAAGYYAATAGLPGRISSFFASVTAGRMLASLASAFAVKTVK